MLLKPFGVIIIYGCDKNVKRIKSYQNNFIPISGAMSQFRFTNDFLSRSWANSKFGTAKDDQTRVKKFSPIGWFSIIPPIFHFEKFANFDSLNRRNSCSSTRRNPNPSQTLAKQSQGKRVIFLGSIRTRNHELGPPLESRFSFSCGNLIFLAFGRLYFFFPCTFSSNSYLACVFVVFI